MTCDTCKKDGHSRLRSIGDLKWGCRGCIPQFTKESGQGGVLKYENIPGYGKVLVSRLKEMERRVVVPDKSDPTGYHCGRLGDNGKVSEKAPGY